jgi:hypothetical protein
MILGPSEILPHLTASVRPRVNVLARVSHEAVSNRLCLPLALQFQHFCVDSTGWRRYQLRRSGKSCKHFRVATEEHCPHGHDHRDPRGAATQQRRT